MPVQKSRETMERQEIIDIIQANADLFKNEPDFANYITELAVYMLENHYEAILERKRQVEGAEAAKLSPPPAPRPSLPKELTDTRAVIDFARRRKLLHELTDTRDFAKKTCPACGLRVEGLKRCRGCGTILS